MIRPAPVVWIVVSVMVGALLIEQSAAAQTKTVEIETGANYRQLSQPYPAWVGAYFRAVVKAGPTDTLNLEVLRQREFDDSGTYFGVADTHVLSPDWYMFLSVGSSSGGFFFPSFRVDAQLNKKWLARKNLVTTVGGGYFDAKDVHRDSNLFVGGVFYFDQPWIVQGGVRWNRSTPGSVISHSQFLAITQGREFKHYLVLRGEFGNEAYQAIGPATILVDFPSHAVSATWKQWFGESWGINAVTEYYSSSVYRRTGANLGIFKSF